jgi:hypothetical protein
VTDAIAGADGGGGDVPPATDRQARSCIQIPKGFRVLCRASASPPRCFARCTARQPSVDFDFRLKHEFARAFFPEAADLII